MIVRVDFLLYYFSHIRSRLQIVPIGAFIASILDTLRINYADQPVSSMSSSIVVAEICGRIKIGRYPVGERSD